MLEFLTRLFRPEPSGVKAKERLRLVLLSDHLALAPELVELMKTDLLGVISRYVNVDTEHVDVTFEQREHEVAMLANVPILSVKTPDERAALASALPPQPIAASDGPTRSKPRRRRRKKAAAAAAATAGSVGGASAQGLPSALPPAAPAPEGLAAAPSPEQRLPEPAST
jgi:cell division topological specificity factor